MSEISEQESEMPAELAIDFLFEKASRLDDEIKARTAEMITPLAEQRDDIEEIIRAKCMEQGASISTAYGIVKYRQAGTRTSWDDKALLDIVADMSAVPLMAAWVARIMACRIVTASSAGTSISYKGGN